MEKDIKVLEVLDTYYPHIDGPCSVVKNYAHFLNKKSACDILVPKDSKKSKYVDNEDFKVYRCKSIPAPEKYRLAQFGLDRKIKKEILSGCYDIIHTHSPFNLGKNAIKCARKLNIPVVATLHTKYYDDFYRSIYKALHIKWLSRLIAKWYTNHIMWVYNNADSVWTVSERSIKTLRDYGYKGDVKIVENGTDLKYPDDAQALIDLIDERHSLKGKKNVFSFIGRMAMYKNLKLLCDALKILKDSGAEFTMLFVGSGFDIDELKKYVESLGLNDKCIFTGSIADRREIQAYYLRSDLFLFPSTFDTASITKFEAAASKTPALLIEGCDSAIGIVDGENGFLCKETAEDFGNKLIELCSKEDGYLKEIGEKAYEKLYRSWETVANEVYDCYQQVIKEYKEKKK